VRIEFGPQLRLRYPDLPQKFDGLRPGVLHLGPVQLHGLAICSPARKTGFKDADGSWKT
jgi:hypothetical protein